MLSPVVPWSVYLNGTSNTLYGDIGIKGWSLTLWWSIGFEMLVILAVAVFMHACITKIKFKK